MSTALAEKAPDATAPTVTNVYQCIVAVASEIAREGIAKTRNNTQQGYKFRGIDELMNVLAPMLARHRLVILPRVLSREVTERATQKGGVLFYVVVECEFDFVSAADGSKHTVKTYGEAMDSADKATNKAMSAAYKYAAFQAFCIPTEGDNDADAHSHEVIARAPAPSGNPRERETVVSRGGETNGFSPIALSASSSNGKTPAFGAGNGGSIPSEATTDPGPDLAVDLPPGAHRVLNVGPGRVGSEGEITFDAKLEGNKDTYLTWQKHVVLAAERFLHTKQPCFVELKKSSSGNYRVERLMEVPEDYQ